MLSDKKEKGIGDMRRQRGMLTGWVILPIILFFFFAFTTDTFVANKYWVF